MILSVGSTKGVMQTMIRQMIQWTLAVSIVASLAIIVSLTLQFGAPAMHVPIHTFVALAAVGIASSVGSLVAVCTKYLVEYTERCIRQREVDIDRRINSLVNGLAEVRITVSEFAGSVGEYGDQRAQAARLDVLKSLAETATIADADRVTPIRRHTAP